MTGFIVEPHLLQTSGDQQRREKGIGMMGHGKGKLSHMRPNAVQGRHSRPARKGVDGKVDVKRLEKNRSDIDSKEFARQSQGLEVSLWDTRQKAFSGNVDTPKVGEGG